jgi:hypothetical protein
VRHIIDGLVAVAHGAGVSNKVIIERTEAKARQASGTERSARGVRGRTPPSHRERSSLKLINCAAPASWWLVGDARTPCTRCFDLIRSLGFTLDTLHTTSCPIIVDVY